MKKTRRRKRIRTGIFSIIVLIVIALFGIDGHSFRINIALSAPKEMTATNKIQGYTYGVESRYIAKTEDSVSGIVPKECTSFMAFMPYTALTNTSSAQWKFQQSIDINYTMHGLQVIGDMYVVAVGTYYADNIGDILEITLSNGTVFYAVVGDFKANIHTDDTNRYNPWSMSVLEFIIDPNVLNSDIKKMGTVSALPYFDSTVTSIEVVGYYKYNLAN